MNFVPRDVKVIPVTWRDQPWSDNLHFIQVRERLTIAEIASRLPEEISSRPIALVNDVPVPRDQWHLVRVKEPTAKTPIIITFPPTIQGGGGGGGNKNILGAVAGIAVLVAAIVVAPYIAGAIAPTLATTFGISAATTLSLTQATLAIGGSLLIAALTPSPVLPTESASVETSQFKDLPAVSLSGNTLSRGGPVPRVVGTMKVFPPFGVPPLQELVGDDIYVEAAYILAGPHALNNICFDDVPITSITNIDYQIREGWSSDTPISLFTRQSKTNPTVVEMSEHVTVNNASQTLENQTTPEVPFWHPTRVRGSPDEYWMTYRWPSGLLDQGAIGTAVWRPMRIRFRQVGTSTWTNVPEIWFANNLNAAFAKDIRIKWGTAPAATDPVTANGPIYAVSMVPMRVQSSEVISGGGTWNAFAANAFDGTSAGSNPELIGSSTDVYIGAHFSVGRAITAASITSKSTGGFAPVSGTLTIELRASNSAPASPSSGTLLATTSFSHDSATWYFKHLASSDATTTYTYIWFRLTGLGNIPYRLSDIWFYGPTEGYGWVASSYFRSNTSPGDKLHYNGVAGHIQNIRMYKDRVDIWLNTATFPKGDYDVEVKMGAPIRSTNMSQQTYSLNSVAFNLVAHGEQYCYYDFFNYCLVSGSKLVPQSFDGLYFKAMRSSAASIWNSNPIVGTDFAVIAIKAKNQQLGQLSVEASGYVQDWTGSAWTNWVTTSNPAPHLRDVLVGSLNADPLPTTLLNEADFLAWRTECVTRGYECNAVFEGRTIIDVANVLCGAGYARLRPAETWGVFMDRDRSAEGPVGVYSHKNLQNFRWDKAFPRLPDGLRVRFSDSANNYVEDEVVVLRSGVVDTGKYEDIRYDGLVTEAEAVARAEFDLAQMTARPVFYNGTTNFQFINNRRGDLVALQVDVLDRLGGSSYVIEVLKSGGSVTGLRLFGSVPIETGSQWGVAIRGLDGSLMIKQITDPGIDGDYKEVTFTYPFDDPGTSVLDEGCLVVSGLVGEEYRRVIIHSILPKKDLADIVFVDEAPQLWGSLTARAIIRQYGLDDSLVLCLDAGDGASYTSGQVWADTSGEDNDFWFGTDAS